LHFRFTPKAAVGHQDANLSLSAINDRLHRRKTTSLFAVDHRESVTDLPIGA
jgi:hypothetical protein